jgi:hypothetical protein
VADAESGEVVNNGSSVVKGKACVQLDTVGCCPAAPHPSPQFVLIRPDVSDLVMAM